MDEVLLSNNIACLINPIALLNGSIAADPPGLTGGVMGTHDTLFLTVPVAFFFTGSLVVSHHPRLQDKNSQEIYIELLKLVAVVAQKASTDAKYRKNKNKLHK